MLSYVLRNDIYLKTFTGIVFAELSIKRCYKKMMQLRAKIQENYNFYCYHTGSLDHIIIHHSTTISHLLDAARFTNISFQRVYNDWNNHWLDKLSSQVCKSHQKGIKWTTHCLFFCLSPGVLSLPNKMLHVVGFELFPKQFRKK